MKVLILLLGFSLCGFSSGALLGAKKCTYGPSYWCANIPNAKECNAVKHCIQSVWERQTLAEDNDDICTLCKEMVKDARDQLESNETQEEIKRVFHGACKLIPIPSIREECIQFSDEYLPELIETLASQMNPQMVCSTAGLCNSPRVDMLLEQYKTQEAPKDIKAEKPSDCPLCKAFIDRLIINVKKHDRKYLLDHLLSICGRLSSLSDGCRMLVEANFSSIYKFFVYQLKSQDMCDLIGMCPGLFGQVTTTFQKTDDAPCDFCVATVGHWRANLISNITKEEFKMVLNGLCHQTGSFERECLSLVDQYFEAFYDVLVSEMNPKEICEAVGFCGRNSIYNVEAPIWPLWSSLPQDHAPLIPMDKGLIGTDEANSYRKEDDSPLPRVSLSKDSVKVVSMGETGVIKQSDSLEGRDICVMCEFVLHFIQSLLDDKMTRKEIRDELDVLCSKLPKSVSEQCQDYVDAYADQVIQLIILEIDPAVICPQIHACPSKLVDEREKPTCFLCELVVGQIDKMLEDNATREEIEKIVKGVCSLLPQQYSKDCKQFLDVYISQLIDMFEHDFTPKQICQQLNLCSKDVQVKETPKILPDAVDAQLPVSRLFIPQPNINEIEEPVLKDTVADPKFCLICEMVVKELDSLLMQNKTEANIIHALEKVCSILPRKLEADCVGFMEEYAQSLIDLLVNDMNPEEVCKAIHLCQNSLVEGLPKAEVKLPVDKCEMCLHVMKGFPIGGSSPHFVGGPEKVNHECSHMPLEWKQECGIMAIAYGDYLYPLLKVLMDRKAVCQSITMCPLDVPLFGAP